MRRILVLLVIVALAYFAYVLLSEDCTGLGITPRTPLGTLKCFDRNLSKVGLRQTPSVNLSLPEFGVETLPSIAFVEHGQPSALNGGESFNVFVDAQGEIRALLGGYKVSSEVQGEYTTIVSNFLVSYWKKVGGGTPSFYNRSVAVSPEYPDGQQHLAVMSQGSVQGQWTKGTSFGQILLYTKNLPE
jgi:hypothetical protein